MISDIDGSGFSDRLKRAADAKQALLAKMRPRPTVTDPQAPSREALRTAELEQVRHARAAAKAAKKQAAADAIEAARLNAEAVEAAALDAKRGERKERKALTKAEAKAKRDARYAARKARK
ncbi:DUF6481 family protein [Phenylobacterium sp.]|uniref:DUF6481 family protein n=1 Tax=Phenylobacterium sp. TaxID=1871053 RepID=UPI002812328E|nr:DUF6481 family protein [Phenylobacterium sp.]